MDNKKSPTEPRYVPIDETIADNPNIQIRIWDERQSRGEGYEGELKLIDVKVTIPFYNTRRVMPHIVLSGVFLEDDPRFVNI